MSNPTYDAVARCAGCGSGRVYVETCGIQVAYRAPDGRLSVIGPRCDRKTCESCAERIAAGHFKGVRAAFQRGPLYVARVDADAFKRLRNGPLRRATYKRISHGDTSTLIATVELPEATQVPSVEALDDVLDQAFRANVEHGGNISGSREWAREPATKTQPRGEVLGIVHAPHRRVLHNFPSDCTHARDDLTPLYVRRGER